MRIFAQWRYRQAKQNPGRLPAVLLGLIFIQRHTVQFCTQTWFYAHKHLVAVQVFNCHERAEFDDRFCVEKTMSFDQYWATCSESFKAPAKFALQTLRVRASDTARAFQSHLDLLRTVGRGGARRPLSAPEAQRWFLLSHQIPCQGLASKKSDLPCSCGVSVADQLQMTLFLQGFTPTSNTMLIRQRSQYCIVAT